MEDRVKVTGIASQSNVAKITVRSVPDRPGVAAALFEPLAAVGISVDTIVQNTSVERFTDISFTVTRDDLPLALREVEELVPSLGASGVVSAMLHWRRSAWWGRGDAEHARATPPGCSGFWPTATSTLT